MSAFIVDKEHIDRIVSAAVASDAISAAAANAAGRMLWRENLLSVAHRYPYDTGNGDRPGPCDFKDSDVDTYVWQPTDILTGNAAPQDAWPAWSLSIVRGTTAGRPAKCARSSNG